MSKKAAVFLDRDGVINETVFRDGKPRSPDGVESFRFLGGVVEAVERLREAGFALVVVTNQPDVARGWLRREDVDAMNRKVLDELAVEAIQVCYHLDEDGCDCRKPKPGLILAAAAERGLDLTRSYMVGDRFSDVAAGAAAGCITLLVGPGDRQGDHPSPAARFASLAEAADWILARPR